MADPRNVARSARSAARRAVGTDPALFHLIHAVKNDLLSRLDEIGSVTGLPEQVAVQGMQLARLSQKLDEVRTLTNHTRSDLLAIRALLPSLSAASVRHSLLAAAVAGKDDQRARMTLTCRDSDAIPKVAEAGTVQDLDGEPVQIMHNGLKVVDGGYYGDWQREIIRGLRGHHEPQEELVFHRVLERIAEARPIMLELGCFWAYYSLWFLHDFPDGTAIAVEPDPDHLDIGKRNAELNDLTPRFYPYASGAGTGEIDLPSELRPGVVHRVPARTVPQIMDEAGVDRLDILHMDIQGYEHRVLDEVEELVHENRIRFVFISTHHHFISGSGATHQLCLDWLGKRDASIIAEHSVAESFSGDGLIVASFDPRDRGFAVDVSYNRAANSLFGPPELDIDRILAIVDGADRTGEGNLGG